MFLYMSVHIWTDPLSVDQIYPLLHITYKKLTHRSHLEQACMLDVFVCMLDTYGLNAAFS